MRKLTLDLLRCVNAPLNSPLDCLVQVWLDDADVREPYLLVQELNTGEFAPPAEPFERHYYFDSNVTFELETGGSLSLGETTVDTSISEGSHTRTFSSGQVEFELEFTVGPDGQSFDSLQLAVDEFRDGEDVVDSNDFSRWRHLDHEDVVDRLEHIATPPEDADRDYIPDVFELDQADVGYCVMAAASFWSVTLQPRRFVEIARSLFEQGGFLGYTDREETSRSLQQSRAADGLEDLEWLVFASLRDTKNWIDDVEEDDPNPGAYRSEARHWLEQLLGFENVTTHRAQVFGERDTLEEASDAVDQGGAGILHVHKEWVTNPVLDFPDENATSWKFRSNHAVAMSEPATVQSGSNPDEDEFLFTVHTWGEQRFVNMEWHYIEDYLFAATVGTPQ